ncbi:hypothetical protein NQT62_03735 [Limnobacter humi]|uniref:Flagellar FliJ protein n=1 Tax=Limnobacter humi TaxID=1778671 RepID=A0ABT1WFM4_9BURK|nr:hypothetical protein [Limnobacter humi]MCQ8895552.1 hypothetical protein [Limnobacter humi]
MDTQIDQILELRRLRTRIQRRTLHIERVKHDAVELQVDQCQTRLHEIQEKRLEHKKNMFGELKLGLATGLDMLRYQQNSHNWLKKQHGMYVELRGARESLLQAKASVIQEEVKLCEFQKKEMKIEEWINGESRF